VQAFSQLVFLLFIDSEGDDLRAVRRGKIQSPNSF
jgi:hypothetical protein